MMRSGYIYILINPALHRDLLKIGKTIRKPEDRAKEISSTGVPAEYRVAFDIESSDCDLAETIVHKKLTAYRYTRNREFFKLPLKIAISEITLIIAEIEKTPPNERAKLSKKYRRSSSKFQENKSTELKKEFPEIDSKYIKKTTNSLFRLNEMDVNGSEVFYSIQNLWKNKNGTQNALVYYSKLSTNLVVVPKNIVDKYIFNPLFEEESQGYALKRRYQNLEYKRGRINIKFRIENDYLSLSIKPLKIHGLPPIQILKLPSKYWPKIIPKERSVTEEIIQVTNELCQSSDRDREIVICHDFRE